MIAVQPQPLGSKARIVTFSASPGSAPSIRTGPVTGFTFSASIASTSAAVESGPIWPFEASITSNSTVSPGAISSAGGRSRFQPR